MKKILLTIALMSMPSVALAGAAYPCLDSGFKQQSAAINISSATTTELVAAVSGVTVVVCNVAVVCTGTSPTFQLETGTKVSSACDTGAVVLTGAAAPTAGSPFYLRGVYSATSSEICAVTGGTPNCQGVISYVPVFNNF